MESTRLGVREVYVQDANGREGNHNPDHQNRVTEVENQGRGNMKSNHGTMEVQNAAAQIFTQNASARINGQGNRDGTHPDQNAQATRGRVEPGGYRRKYSRGSIITCRSADALTGAAQAWFSTLHANSIGSLEEFGQKFLLNFATSKKYPKSEFAVGKIRKQPEETLQRYLNRFKDAILQVSGLPENVHVHLIVAGLDGASRLAKSIYKDPVRTLEEFRTRSKKYLELEQVEIENAQFEEGRRVSPRRRSPTPREKERAIGKKKDSRGKNLDDRDWVGRYEKYTPLNASHSLIWREVAMTEMKKMDKPRPIFDRGGLDKSKYCAFHNGPGHNTDQCWDLRDAVEKFIREGKLRQYVIKTQDSKNKRKSGNRKRRGGHTVNARRKYLKKVLSIQDRPIFKKDPSKPNPHLLYFTKEDMQGVLPGHVDGLVVTGILVSYRVKKIFIDAGSSADIILWGAFKKMNLDEEDLKTCKTTLIAFNGENKPLKCYIDLRLTLETKEAFKSK
ncbi:uncharacterized protein LOC133309681 [Gastrolobium bilobum]|uniref:uncharacterized protein LOC133309681 n=1 Tax=Gastrolobium bilobum TaxID=150636 RepID=UPI002AB1BD40|nr:uncharacterized protein LOC133309681 [Gastrolobium bilobum]